MKQRKNIRKQTLKIVFLEIRNLGIALYSSIGDDLAGNIFFFW